MTRRLSASDVVVDPAVDDGRVLGGEGADDVHHLGLAQLGSAAKRGVDQHAARAGEVHALEQRAGDRLLGGDARAVDAAADAEPIIAMPCSDMPFTSWKSTFTNRAG